LPLYLRAITVGGYTMTISITRDQSTPMRHVVRVGDHVVTVDSPVADGGEGAGLSPHDLYDAALGACKALTMLYFANRQGMKVEDIRVQVKRDDSRERQGTYHLDTTIEVTGALSEEQRAQLLRVAGKCPVHKLMTAVTTEITTEWAND
jgi:putative redox protein